jgi:DNA-binding NtrC family response regulator
LKLLIVEDDEDVRAQMKWALAQDYEILTAGSRAEAMAAIRAHQPRVVILDLGLPPHPASTEEGFATLAEAVAADPYIKVVIVTGRAEKEHALKAIAQGAYDILYKPVQLDELGTILKRAYHVSGLEREHAELQRRLGEGAFEGMLGTSPKMQDVFATVRKVATTEVPVLITGESGTGKELVALAIHRLSTRKNGPFVVINCGAIPETLLESELFGHEKGSFTGAHVQRKGRIELADKGTLFLDEIGELSLPLQVKILRFLQEQTIERVGGREQLRVDARVIAATIRTSTSTGCSPPSRKKAPSWMARSSLTCIAGPISPTSSRNRVPPSASSNFPRRCWLAPVKEPFSWPNSSLSINSCGMAAQLSLTKGWPLRRLFSWMARATSSLPVPFSPVMSTRPSLGAALRMSS